jgi:hypothetical protein
LNTGHIGESNSKTLLAPNFGKKGIGLLHCFEIWDVTNTFLPIRVFIVVRAKESKM